MRFMATFGFAVKGKRRSAMAWIVLVLCASLMLAGCGLFSRGAAEESQGEEAGRELVPTFTPTAEGVAPTPTATIEFAVSDAAPAPVLPAAGVTTTAPAVTGTVPGVTNTQGITAAAQVTSTAGATLTASGTPTPTAHAKLTVTQDLINVRSGPGLNYGLAGEATKDQAFDIIAKDSTGQWWQVCCVSGEPVWVYGELAKVENTDSVAVAQNLPAAPAPVAAVSQPAPAESAPAAEPAPTDTPAAPAPAPAADPCANIGGDGCKFKLRGGPAFTANGGSELKLTLAFVHSGIDGGQPQGSYFIVLLKDGQNLMIPDSVRSFDPSVAMREGPNGKYNYEYKVDLARLPGNSVAGNYTIWVLDGNGERDSEDYNFTVPDGQGEVWIKFDQA